MPLPCLRNAWWREKARRSTAKRPGERLHVGVHSSLRKREGVAFEYDGGMLHAPRISFSLEDGSGADAPENFLVLHPESGAACAKCHDAGSRRSARNPQESFDLLENVDSLVRWCSLGTMRCHSVRVSLCQCTSCSKQPMTKSRRIAAVKRTPDSWFVRNKGARFSLAGTTRQILCPV